MTTFAKAWVTHIVENFDNLIYLSNEYSPPLYIWKDFTDKYICGIPESGEIMKRLVVRGKIKKEHLSLFASKFCSLDFYAYLSGMKLDNQAVRFVCDKSLFKVDISYCPGVRLNEVLDCLMEYSKFTLQTLNIPGIEFDFNSLASLNSFMNSKWLNLRHSYLDDEGLEVLSNALTNIVYLDISFTNVQDIKSLQKFEDTLIELNLRNLSLSDTAIATLSVLRNLKVLDISKHYYLNSTRIQDIETLITDSLPNLMEIDLGGNRFDLTFDELKDFIENHKNLRFVGLVQWEDQKNATVELALRYKHIKFASHKSREMNLNILLRYCSKVVDEYISSYFVEGSGRILKKEYICAMEALNLALQTYRHNKSIVDRCISKMDCVISYFQYLPKDIALKVKETVLDYLANRKNEITIFNSSFRLFTAMDFYSDLKMDKLWWFNSLFELMKDSKSEKVYFGSPTYKNACLIFSKMSQEERDEIGSQRKVLCFLLQHITRRVLGIENIEEIINTAKDVSKGTDLANEMETYVIKLLRTLLDGSSDARTTFLKICGLQILLTIFKRMELWRWDGGSSKNFLAEILAIFTLYARDSNLKAIFLTDACLKNFKFLLRSFVNNISCYTCDIVYRLLCTPKAAWDNLKCTKNKIIKSLGSRKWPAVVDSTEEIICHRESRLDIVYYILKNIRKHYCVQYLKDYPKLQRCILYFAYLSGDTITSASSQSFKYPFNVPANADLPASWQYLRAEIKNCLAPLDKAENMNANVDVEVEEEEEDCDGCWKFDRVRQICEISKEILQKAIDEESKSAHDSN